ncbi:MAG: hypothetical protein U9R48_03965, partial [Chloroflexota bacterium]|nr:hypothetical protein [Chloroflexota bacterium]
AGFVLLAGLSAWQDVALFSILVYLGWYLLYNVRRPMTVALVTDRIEQRVMASGLSVESQFTTLITVVAAPALGALADRFGVGVALFAFGVGMLLLARLLHLEEGKARIPQVAVPGMADPPDEG